MTVYSYTMPWGDTLRIRADLTRAEAPIEYEGDHGQWVSTPWQTADARHDEVRTMVLVVEYLGPDYYADPEGGSAAAQRRALIEAMEEEGLTLEDEDEDEDEDGR